MHEEHAGTINHPVVNFPLNLSMLRRNLMFVRFHGNIFQFSGAISI